MSPHQEIDLETEICDHLAANGWLHDERGAAKYDRARALFPEDVLASVQETHPNAWDAIANNHGTHATDTLLTRLRDQIDQRGTLGVRRHGMDMLGLRGNLSLAQFKPALAINPEILARYAANRLRVVRQVRYDPFGIDGTVKSHDAIVGQLDQGHRAMPALLKALEAVVRGDRVVSGGPLRDNARRNHTFASRAETPPCKRERL